MLLRMLEQNEAHLMSAYVNENREHLEQLEPRRSESYYKPEFWEAEIKNIYNDFLMGHALRLCIFFRNSPKGPIIGVCNFTSILRGVLQACFLGYSVDHKYQGQGIMYEALNAATDFVFKELKLHRIMANYMPRNEKSGKLLKKLDFTIEGYARDYLKINGQWEDHILTAKISPY